MTLQAISQSDFERLQHEIFEELVYFGTHLPFKDRDDTTVVLKGHLLIEEQIVSYVGRRLKNPDKIERFTFDQYLRLAEAFNDIAAFDWIFEACRKLNQIRNKISHQLSPSGFEGAISDYVDHISNHGHALFPKDLMTINRPEFRMAIFAVYSCQRSVKVYHPGSIQNVPL